MVEANFELDYFNRPVVKRDIWNTDEPETSATTVRRILYEGGGEWTE